MSSKLMPKHLLNFVLSMKHGNVIMYVSFMWNWSKFALCDDVTFIASCINHALKDEIRWPTHEKNVILGAHLQKILRCIGFINGILIEIC
jgi:hypothetical protein